MGKPEYKLRFKDILNPIGWYYYHKRTEDIYYFGGRTKEILKTSDEVEKALIRIIGLAVWDAAYTTTIAIGVLTGLESLLK